MEKTLSIIGCLTGYISLCITFAKALYDIQNAKRARQISEFTLIKNEVKRIQDGIRVVLYYIGNHYNNDKDVEKYIMDIFSIARQLPDEITNLVDPVRLALIDYRFEMKNKERIGLYLMDVIPDINKALNQILKRSSYKFIKPTITYTRWELNNRLVRSSFDKAVKLIVNLMSNHSKRESKVQKMVFGKDVFKIESIRFTNLPPLPKENFKDTNIPILLT